MQSQRRDCVRHRVPSVKCPRSGRNGVCRAITEADLTDAKVCVTDGVAFSTEPQEAGAVLFSVPDEEWLNSETCRQSEIGAAVAGQPAWLQLAIYLIFATEQRISPWMSCIKDLKRSERVPVVLWSDDELQALQGTQMLDAVSDYRAFFAREFARVEQDVLPKLPAGVAAACTLPAFQDAAATVRARLIPPFASGEPSIAPGIELVQHSRKPNVDLQVRATGFMGRSKKLEVTALSALATSEPLRADYGASLLESQIALDYGAYDPAGGRAGYALTLQLPGEEADSNYYDKLDIVELAGLRAQQTFTLRAREQPPPDMLAFLRLINLSGPDLFLLESIFRNEAWDHMMEPVSEANEEAVCRSMLAGCEAALGAFSSSLAADMQELNDLGEDAPIQRRTALLIRVAEKEVLEDAGAWCTQRLKDVPKLEYYHERRLKRLGLLDDDGESTFEDMVRINV